MSILRNSAGIPIRKGQVWNGSDKNLREVTGSRGDIVCTWHPHAHFAGFHRSGSVFDRLISDPVWGDMSDWRIVTEAEKLEHEVPFHAEYWNGGEWVLLTPARRRGEWMQAASIFRVPRSFQWPDKPAEHPPCPVCGAERMKITDVRIPLAVMTSTTMNEYFENVRPLDEHFLSAMREIIEAVNAMIKDAEDEA